MIKFGKKALGAALLAGSLIMGLASGASAETRRHLGSYNDWDAFVYGTGATRTCHMVSVPKTWSASKEGVSRGEIYLMVSHRPEYKVTGEVSIVMGYPVRPGSEATLQVDGRKRFDFFTEGDGAWAYDPKDDVAVVAAMKAGSGLVVTAASQRGTRTTDKYSLSGFTAAFNAITKACK
ncbi:invasion associated locus B family protein [Kordiimonas pumila]|uniref:Invasion associated locus B family protein n=1 Tax=Kordiimonas pumila TaxID=2161677 RepID=A0ABV7D2V0_9PROT|nr:invasion associated locus B family protein [Kordiimonas pumila]